MPLQRPARIVRRHLRLAAGTAAAVLAATIAFTLAQPARYEARSQIFISVLAQRPSDALVGAVAFTQTQMATYVDLVTTAAVLSPAVTRLGSAETPQDLAAHVTASNPFDTTMIEIRVRDGSPGRAADLADAVAEEAVLRIPQLAGGAPAAATTGQPGTQTAATSTISAVRTTPAAVPDRPVTPNWPRNVIVGLFAGLCLGLAAAVTREERARSGGSLRGLPDLAGAPVLAVVPDDRGPQRDSLRDEAFRRLRDNLAYLTAERDVRVVVVTAATPHSGATSVAADLAVGLAASGVTVALADGNLRRPALAQRFSMPIAPGLTNLLRGGGLDLPSVLQQWHHDLPLAVLTVGSRPKAPATLLASPTLPPVIEALRGSAWIVVIDAPPMSSFGDAAVLARAGDGAVLVITPDDTGADIRAAQAALKLAGADLLGLVVNRADADWSAEQQADGGPTRRPGMVRS